MLRALPLPRLNEASIDTTYPLSLTHGCMGTANNDFDGRRLAVETNWFQCRCLLQNNVVTPLAGANFGRTTICMHTFKLIPHIRFTMLAGSMTPAVPALSPRSPARPAIYWYRQHLKH